MPATLYLRPSPRAFFLLTETHALVFRQPDASETKASKSVVVAEFLPIEEVDTRGLVKACRGRNVEGVLGVTSVPSDRSPIPEIFLLLVSHSTSLPSLLPSASSSIRPQKVIGVEFHSLTSSFWDSPELLSASASAQQQALGYDEFDYDDPNPSGPSYTSGGSTMSQAQQMGLENPCNGMRKYLESGSFFYADGESWDISKRLDESNWILSSIGKSQDHPLENFDERFIWNSSLLQPFLNFRLNLPHDQRRELDDQALLIPIIQGFINSLPISTGYSSSTGKHEVASLGLISRLSWKRAGARFRTRGIDDNGQVANFVETELVLATESTLMSYSQVRGSVPLFWEQPSQGLGTLQQKVELTRPPQATQPAFDKHFLELMSHYHSIHAINLLGQKDAESMLSSAYSHHLESLKHTLAANPEKDDTLDGQTRGTIDLTPYDFHYAVKMGGHEMVKYDFSMRLDEVVDSMERFGWTAIDTTDGQVIEKQDGVFRVNCLDCLDRTNYVQDVISSLTLSRYLNSIGSPLQSSQTLWSAHRELWADNGDRLSKIYAGTGALNTSATRSGKKTFAGLLSDATKSVGRAYINNFQDKGKQNAIDMLLGMMSGQRPVILFDPISDSVQAALTARLNEYSHTKVLSIFSGTWNLNGKAPDEALDSWLFPRNTPEPDIYMIAFQEIVELTAGQILQTDPAKKRVWEKFIMDTFTMRKGEKSDYLLYRSEQLVGSALIIIVKSSLAPHMRNVESTTKKAAYKTFQQTGLSGLSGNKGGVAIRFQLYDSDICFVTSHLTAGQSNVTERNSDWKTLTAGMKFSRGRMVEDHEIIIWSADLNYRIALPNADVRQAIEDGSLDALLDSDQLLNAMDAGETFRGYEEGPISFLSVVRYFLDNGTEDYDTSEKQRVPAWTDRVLFKGSALRLKDYNRAELMTSDHRPVYAVFDATIREVDHARKDAISKEIVHSILTSGGEKKMDEKVEDVVRGHGGPRDLVRDLARVSVTPSLRTPSPRQPPRPTSAASMKETHSPVTATARLHSQSLSTPQTASSSLRALSSSTSSSSLKQNARRPPPAIPTRSAISSDIQANSFVPQNSDRRSPIPRSSSRGMLANGTGSTHLSNSTPTPSITPSTTGDFVIVPNTNTNSKSYPPPLPPRAIPTPKSSLDVKPSEQGKIPVIPRSSSGSVVSKINGEEKEVQEGLSLNQLRAKFENPNKDASVTNPVKPKPIAVVAKLPRKSMDINGSPQEGLMSPVKPDKPHGPTPAIPTKPRRLSSGIAKSPQKYNGAGAGDGDGDGSPEKEKKKPEVPKKPIGLKERWDGT
ncbi:phosphatidylinositol phosphate phosphatase [Kwoniella mangroviensis CBS 8886]|nr:phosphatidylinositol phosphate phosphatase [Kwoniella mangroviensis CBS 8886]